MVKEANTYLLTSESVCESHPDRVADLISNRLLDQFLRFDPEAHCGIEVQCSRDLVVVAGEVSCKSHPDSVDVETTVRTVASLLGYNEPEYGFAAHTLKVINNLSEQSRDLYESAAHNSGNSAGDNGMMTGYATSLDGTANMMPLPITLAHAITRRLDECRRRVFIKGLFPDGKAQVTVRYNAETRKPISVATIVVCVAHHPDCDTDYLSKAVLEEVVKKVIPGYLLNEDTEYYFNPSGRFVEHGPAADCGTTGRKLAVDTYGGLVPIGGGNPGGKDATKVDKTGLFLARFIAKSIVYSNLAREAQVQIAYAIGRSEPVSINVNTFGTCLKPLTDEALAAIVKENMPLTPRQAIEMWSLNSPIYENLSVYGYLGRDKEEAPWEEPYYIETPYNPIYNSNRIEQIDGTGKPNPMGPEIPSDPSTDDFTKNLVIPEVEVSEDPTEKPN